MTRITVQRDGMVWVERVRIGWVKKEGRNWLAYEADQMGHRHLIAGKCPTRYEAVNALRWPLDTPEAFL